MNQPSLLIANILEFHTHSVPSLENHLKIEEKT